MLNFEAMVLHRPLRENHLLCRGPRRASYRFRFSFCVLFARVIDGVVVHQVNLCHLDLSFRQTQIHEQERTTG